MELFLLEFLINSFALNFFEPFLTPCLIISLVLKIGYGFGVLGRPERLISPDTLPPAPESEAAFMKRYNITSGKCSYMEMIQTPN